MLLIYSYSIQVPPKYTEDYAEICPKCGETIKLGCNGPTNMENHVRKTRCLVAQKWKAKEAKVKPQGTLSLAMFKPRPKVVSMVLAPEVVVGKLHSMVGGMDLPILLEESPSIAPIIDCPTALLSPPQLTSAILKLAQHALQLPDMLPVATPDNRIASLSGDPPSILQGLHSGNEDPYEWLDVQLNSVCGQWAITQRGGIQALALKQGEFPLVALSHTANYWVVKGILFEDWMN